MIKPVNVISLTIIVLSAFGLFQIKHYVQNLSKDHIELIKYVAQEKETIHVLKAEWAYLNQPDRLRKIIANHLELEIINITQIHKMNDNLPIELAEINTENSETNRENTSDNFAKNIMNPNAVEKFKLVQEKIFADKKAKYKFSKVKF